MILRCSIISTLIIQIDIDDGKFEFDAYFDKSFMKYDISKGGMVVNAKGIKISRDNDDYDEENEENIASGVPAYKGSKVQYMLFTKREYRNLHYVI